MQNVQKDEASIVQPIRLELNLSGISRSSRFLGTYDEIDRLTLDLNRVYGNRKVVTGMELNKDNQTSKWIGSIDKLIVGFDYTITGHAYKTYDNGTSVEIFRGETLHTVDEGVNTISLRMSPLLDDRNLSVPRITRMERPFQMSTGDSDNITISVDTVSEDDNAVDGELFYRFRVVDNLTGMALEDSVLTEVFQVVREHCRRMEANIQISPVGILLLIIEAHKKFKSVSPTNSKLVSPPISIFSSRTTSVSRQESITVLSF